MKKVVIDVRMIRSSGIGRYIDNMVRILSLNADFELSLLANSTDLLAGTILASAKIVPFEVLIYSVQEQLRYPKIISDCDLFWSPHFNVPLLPTRAKKRLVTIHDVFHLAYWDSLSLKQKLYAKVVYKAAVSKSDAIITVSEFSKSEILRLIDPKVEGKVHVIPNGGARVREDLWIPLEQKDRYFLYVGNIKPHKNLHRILDAFLLFLIDNSDCGFKLYLIGKQKGFITGDNSIQELLEREPLLKHHVQFTGYVSDEELQEYYRKAYCLVFPSLYEGFGLPPLEAMSVGTPVITSNAASLPEVCGDAAIYVDPMDIESIKNAMQLVLENPSLLNEKIARGKFQCMQFNWAKCGQAHLDLIHSLLDN